MNHTLTAHIPQEFAGLRLDQALARLFPEYSRTQLQSWIQPPLRPKDKVQGGEEIILDMGEPPVSTGAWAKAESGVLDIVYEDEAILVINKPAGIVVHPAAGHWNGTLVNALLHYLPALTTLPRAGIVHRIDKDTSGLLVVAKTLQAHTALVRQLQSHKVQREYRAIARGSFTGGGTIEAPVARHAVHRKRMAVMHSGKPAVTHYRILERFRGHTYLSIQLETGRTHQIRIHMAHIHHPLVGDVTYGGRLQIPAGTSPELIENLRQFKRQALHATKLGLIHPVTKQPIEWTIPIPDDLEELLKALRADFISRPEHT